LSPEIFAVFRYDINFINSLLLTSHVPLNTLRPKRRWRFITVCLCAYWHVLWTRVDLQSLQMSYRASITSERHSSGSYLNAPGLNFHFKGFRSFIVTV